MCRPLHEFLQTNPSSDAVWGAVNAEGLGSTVKQPRLDLQLAVLKTRVEAALKQETAQQDGRVYLLVMAGKGRDINFAGNRSKYGAINSCGNNGLIQVLHMAACAAGLSADETGGHGVRIFVDGSDDVALCGSPRSQLTRASLTTLLVLRAMECFGALFLGPKIGAESRHGFAATAQFGGGGRSACTLPPRSQPRSHGRAALVLARPLKPTLPPPSAPLACLVP